jgi:hypothetical protein
MPIIQIEVPDGRWCTGCPCGIMLPPAISKSEGKWWAYGCALLHDRCKSGGEYDNYAIKHPKCPSLNPSLVIKQSSILKQRGSQGGLARAEKLSPKRRKEIAQNAAKARWAKSK